LGANRGCAETRSGIAYSERRCVSCEERRLLWKQGENKATHGSALAEGETDIDQKNAEGETDMPGQERCRRSLERRSERADMLNRSHEISRASCTSARSTADGKAHQNVHSMAKNGQKWPKSEPDMHQKGGQRREKYGCFVAARRAAPRRDVEFRLTRSSKGAAPGPRANLFKRSPAGHHSCLALHRVIEYPEPDHSNPRRMCLRIRNSVARSGEGSPNAASASRSHPRNTADTGFTGPKMRSRACEF